MTAILFFLLFALQAYAQDNDADDFDFSLERLRQFQNFYLIEERDVIHSIVNPIPNPGPPPIPPPPPPPPLPPYPSNGGVPTKLPVVIVNNSGCADSDIWVVVPGQDATTLPPAPATGFVSFVAGVGTFIPGAAPFDMYAVQLTSLISKGNHAYAMYLPYISGRVYLSLKQKLTVAQPASWDPTDPNYNTIWDFTEITYSTSVNNLTVNVTAVDAYGLPFFLYLADSVMPTLSLGLTYARQQVLNTIQNYFPFLDKTSDQAWGHTILQNLSGAITRVLSPGTAMNHPSVAEPFFGDYLNNPALSQGYTWVGDAWNGFFKTNPMTLQCLRSSNIYGGTVDNSGRLNLYRSGHAGDPMFLVSIGTAGVGTNSFSAQIFNAVDPLTDLTSGGSVTANDVFDLCQMLQSGIQSGYLPTTNLVSQNNLRSAASSLYSPNTNLSQVGQNTGPWSSLYTNVINKLGAIYTFPWSDVLIGPPAGAAISYATFTMNSTYYSIILNDCTGSTGACP